MYSNLSSEVPTLAIPQKSEGEFLRTEDKYIISFSHRDHILELINKYMKPSYPDSDTQYTLIESIYFDSKNLDFFKHDVTDYPTQYKLRIRQYAPNGKFNPRAPAHLELKRKRGQESKKLRFKIGPMQLLGLYKGESLPMNDEVIAINKDIELQVLISRMKIINDLMGEFLLRPVTSISYNRLAFEQGDLRVTMDTDISEKRLVDVLNRRDFKTFTKLDKAEKMMKMFSAQECFILEVKHQGHIPSWLENLLNELSLPKESFSKYTYFTAKAIDGQITVQ